MPEVFLKKIIGNILICTGCFLIGLINFIVYGDKIIFTMSLIISLCFIARTLLLYRIYKAENYNVIEGVFVGAERKFFTGYIIAEIETADERLKLYLPKDTKLNYNSKYAFYFKNISFDATQIISPGIVCKLNSDSFLGYSEIIE